MVDELNIKIRVRLPRWSHKLYLPDLKSSKVDIKVDLSTKVQ